MMEQIQAFLTTQTVASTALYLCIAAFTGVLLGKLEIKGFKLGIAGVLFTGILVAHFGAQIDEHTLHFLRDFGLIMFVFGRTRYCRFRNRYGLCHYLSIRNFGNHHYHAADTALFQDKYPVGSRKIYRIVGQ